MARELRVIIYTGKGGVGKTSVAAATALRSARMGHRTIVMSTDSAHSLSDSLEVQLSGEIRNIENNLDAIEVDVVHELETRWKEVQTYISDFLRSQGLGEINAKEMTVWPGMELMSALFYVWDFYEKKTYDVVILDTAPTAETLRLLSFPEISDWYFDRIYKVFRNILKLARATVGKFMKSPLPSDDVLRDIETIRNRLTSVRKILTDPTITSVRLVVNPERMVINETKRAFTYLCLYDLTVECLIVNRLLPQCSDGYFRDKLNEQQGYMGIINESFSPLTILTATLMPTELVGKESLEGLADMVFGTTDPTMIYSVEKPMEIYEEDGSSILSLRLPFSTKEQVELYKSEDALIVQVGSYKRSVSLPYSLLHMETKKAEFVDGRLLITFGGSERNGREGRKDKRRGEEDEGRAALEGDD
ncbi:MAG: ArsA family ATPase [Methanomassiliicoccales archaeon]|nr:ArsA family ATPase [Methanomassiliicoccales archaeon]